MKLFIHLILKTEKEDKARIVIARLNKIFSADLLKMQKYPKGGTSVRLSKEMLAPSWAEAVLVCFELAQSFGRSWKVFGSIMDEVDLVSSELSISGIDWGHVRLERKATLES